jgi:hypothetical protein
VVQCLLRDEMAAPSILRRGEGGERVCVERGLKEDGGDEACSHRCKDGGK